MDGASGAASPGQPDALCLFDDACRFCSGSIQLVLKLDRQGVIRLVPLNSPYGQHLAGRHGLDPQDPSTFLFFDRGRALAASDAILALVARLPWPWPWLGFLRWLPRSWRDGTYAFVARHRYRILGRTAACMVPTPEQRNRFIDEIPPPA